MSPQNATYEAVGGRPLVHPLLAIGLVLGILMILILGLQWCRGRFNMSPEVSRKMLHVLMGLVALTFPWLFSEVLPVFVVSGLSASFLAALRWNTHLRRLSEKVLLAVDRTSFGEFCFPAAVGIVFWLSDGRPASYTAAILCLTLADTTGALVGQRFGKHKFQALGGTKSLEGSSAFFVVANVAVWSTLAIWGLEPATAMPIACMVAATTTLLEAVSPNGTDNLTVPVGAMLVLGPSLAAQWVTTGSLILLLTLPAMAVLVAAARGRRTLIPAGTRVSKLERIRR